MSANSDTIEYKGKTIHRLYRFDKTGEFVFRFTFNSTNSDFTQSIVMFYDEFEGDIFLNDINISKNKKKFSYFAFFEDTSPKQFELKVKLVGGTLEICNGVDPSGTKEGCTTLVWGCALIIEEIAENHFRFYCNDHENDDDFDDLIYELEIFEYPIK